MTTGGISVRALIKAMEGRKVLVVGDIMLDEYVFGDVTRISPEAPVPVVRVSRKEFRPGGAANVAMNIKALGGEPHLVGVVGKDDTGRALKDILAARKISFSLAELENFPTTRKTRVMALKQQVVRIDQEDCHFSWKAEEFEKISPERIEGEFDAFCFSDYRKGFFRPKFTRQWIAFARRKKLICCADPKPENIALFRNASVVSPNQAEAEKIVGYPIRQNSDLMKAAKELSENYKINGVLITLGEKGMFAYQKHKTKFIPAFTREVYDVTGAGDTVLASLTLALAAGISFFEAAIFANTAAAAVVQKLGASAPTKEELVSFNVPGLKL